jgi:hypothetical protein
MKKTKKRVKFSTVSLPRVLVEKIKKQMQGTGFTSVSSYVEFIMREVVASGKNKKVEEGVKAKLRALGYI